MKNFIVKGYFEVPLKNVDTPNRKGKEINTSRINDFWTAVDYNENISSKKGVYIFANKVSHGFKPIYVGMTVNSFKNECFKDHKIRKLQSFFDKSLRTKLVLFFIVKESNRDARDDNDIIADVESFFIHQAYMANDNLLNDRKKDPKWSVQDVSGNRTPGQPTVSVQNLKQCLNMD
jgi:hypothetical protein